MSTLRAPSGRPATRTAWSYRKEDGTTGPLVFAHDREAALFASMLGSLSLDNLLTLSCLVDEKIALLVGTPRGPPPSPSPARSLSASALLEKEEALDSVPEGVDGEESP